MSERRLTIIDTGSRLTEVNLDAYGKQELKIGRKKERCDIVIPDEIISGLHGIFRLQGDKIYYMDQDSSNGTFVGNSGQKKLLDAKAGYVELFDKSVLRIGNIHAPDKMVLLLLQVVAEDEVWKTKSLDGSSITIGRSRELSLIHI